MRQRINTRFANCLLAIGLSGLAPVAAQAQAANDKWQWELGVYGWFPAIGATTSFPSGAGGPSVDVSASDVIDSLKMTFMGQVEARKGQWGVWSDLVYADLGGSKDGTRDFSVGGRPSTRHANLSLDVKSTAWSLAGIYNLTSTAENTTDLLFGARMLDMKQTLNWSLASSIPELPTRKRRGERRRHQLGRHRRPQGPLLPRRRAQVVPAVLRRRRHAASPVSPGRSTRAWATASTGVRRLPPGATWTTTSSRAMRCRA